MIEPCGKAREVTTLDLENLLESLRSTLLCFLHLGYPNVSHLKYHKSYHIGPKWDVGVGSCITDRNNDTERTKCYHKAISTTSTPPIEGVKVPWDMMISQTVPHMVMLSDTPRGSHIPSPVPVSHCVHAAMTPPTVIHTMHCRYCKLPPMWYGPQKSSDRF